MPALTPIRTLIVDDEGVIRGGLRAFLELNRRIEIIGEAVSGVQALQMTFCYRPDIVILDIGLHDIDGLEVARQIHGVMPDVRIICIAHDVKTRPSAAASPKNVKDFLFKGITSWQLLDSIDRVMNGGGSLNLNQPISI